MKPFFNYLAIILTTIVLGVGVAAQPVSLDGGWDFAPEPTGRVTIETLGQIGTWRTIQVPYSWNSQFADLRDYRGVAWYRRTVSFPTLGAAQTILLNFGAVDYQATVYVNGRRAGENEGGYLPFQIDIGALVKAGKNEIVVRVIDPDENRERWKGMNFNEIPHGKQGWYVHTGGIWQSVSWQVRPVSYLTAVRVTAGIDGAVEVEVERRDSPRAGGRVAAGLVEVTLFDPNGKVAGRVAGKMAGEGQTRLTASLKVAGPRLWSPDHPNLYRVEVRYGGDRLTDRFGFRKFETRDAMIHLNGEPFYMISALDQDFYPEGIQTPPGYEFLVAQMKRAKQLGLNMLRTHIKVPTPDYLRAADETGLLIWYEVPSWEERGWSKEAGQRGEAIFLGQLARDWNHPSVVIQSIINEGWGVLDLREDEPRKWLREAFKRLAPQAARAGRLTVDNSACCENFHLVSDLADFHKYRSIPDHRRAWDYWLTQLAARPDWLWSRHGDAERRDDIPIILSEFGNWGLPELRDGEPARPWWFNRDFRGEEVTRPQGVLDRFRDFKLSRLFADFNELARATQRHQWISLKYEIEEIRRHHAIQGYTITEFTDLNWEANGLLDIYRRPKLYAEALAGIQRPDLVMARPNNWNYTSGEIIELKTWVSRYSAAATRPLKVHYLIDGREVNRLEVPALARGAVFKDIWKNLKAPQVAAPQPLKVRLELRDGDRLVADNEMVVFIYPAAKLQKGTILLNSRLYKMEAGLVAAGFTMVEAPGPETVIITDQIDEMTRGYLQAGHAVLHIAAMPETLPGGNLKIVVREDNPKYEGDWVTNFNWIDGRSGPFKGLAFDSLLGFEADETMPMMVIDGLAAEHFDDVMAGIFLGWINNNGALMMGARIGAGRAILTTFNLVETYATDPYARQLVDQSISLLRDKSFRPRLQLPLPAARAEGR